MKFTALVMVSTAVLGFSACSDDDATAGDAGVGSGGAASGGSAAGGHAAVGGHAAGGTPVGGTPTGGTPTGGTPTGGEATGGMVAAGGMFVCPEPAPAGGAGGAGGAEAAGGTGGAGGAPAVDPALLARCETQCSRLADCATADDPDLCLCYDPDNNEALKAGCMDTCTGPTGAAVLSIAEGMAAATCEGLVRIIKGVNAQFKTGCIGVPAP